MENDKRGNVFFGKAGTKVGGMRRLRNNGSAGSDD
jgi:hypothetical protein